MGDCAAFVGAELNVMPQCFHFGANRYPTRGIGTFTRMTKQQQTLLLLLHRLDRQFGQSMSMSSIVTILIPQCGIDLRLRQTVQMLWIGGGEADSGLMAVAAPPGEEDAAAAAFVGSLLSASALSALGGGAAVGCVSLLLSAVLVLDSNGASMLLLLLLLL